MTHKNRLRNSFDIGAACKMSSIYETYGKILLTVVLHTMLTEIKEDFCKVGFHLKSAI
jgi:hypothetical protein